MIYADSFLPEKDRRKDCAKQPVSGGEEENLFNSFHFSLYHLLLSLNSSSFQVTFAIADNSGVCVILYLCISDRETDKMQQGLVPVPPVSDLSVHPIKKSWYEAD